MTAKILSTPVNARVQKHCQGLRRAGLRPIQLWVVDTRSPHFAEECQEQCQRVAAHDLDDDTMDRVLEVTLHECDGWAA